MSLLRDAPPAAPLLWTRALCVRSARDAPVVFGLEAGEAVPEWTWLLAGHTGDQHVEMRVPAGADANHHAASRQATVNHGEQHFLAPRFERHRNVAVFVAPSEDEFARRIDLDDPALHAVLLTKTVRPLARRIGELAVAPDEFERRAHLQLHVS